MAQRGAHEEQRRGGGHRAPTGYLIGVAAAAVLLPARALRTTRSHAELTKTLGWGAWLLTGSAVLAWPLRSLLAPVMALAVALAALLATLAFLLERRRLALVRAAGELARVPVERAEIPPGTPSLVAEPTHAVVSHEANGYRDRPLAQYLV